ncbi:hypothetical protein HKD28_03050 [Gluconobacter sp. LMG 1744]|uniref:restriction endonuclease subunit S n=1 Tax=Gluconobacter cadivus TaxID=2728101 RepID=UPI0018852F30|nr:hypothetical protein [Gluconobacter cadivus]MBF0890404.1 hypothetical protein [Gluconobacter cadivus]
MSAVSQLLPNGWKCVALRELVTLAGAQVKPWLQPDEAFNYIGLEDIEAGTGRLLDILPTFGREIASTKSQFRRGDLLYGRLRPYLQKVIIAPSDGIAATELLVLRIDPAVDAAFLHEVLLGPDHLAQITKLMSGARMPRVRSEQLFDCAVMLPPRDVQCRIARALAVVRDRLRVLGQSVAEGLSLAEQFEKALLSAAFDGRLSGEIRTTLNYDGDLDVLGELAAARRATWEEARRLSEESGSRGTKKNYPSAATPDVASRTFGLPPQWAWASLAEIGSAADPLCYGIVQPGDDVEQGVPLVRVQDIKAGGIDQSHLRHVSDAVDRKYVRSRLRGGEVLVSLVGIIGQVARVPESLAGANIARAVGKITPSDPSLEKWIASVLQSPSLERWMTSSARGVAQNTLNLSRLVRAPIPIAPRQERQWLLEQLERRGAALAGLRAKLADIVLALDNLWINVQTRALNGTIDLSDLGDEAVMAAQADHSAESEHRPGGKRRKAKGVTATKLKPGAPATRRDLQAVLDEYKDGLEPLRLLEEAGFRLDDVEPFFKALADGVAAGRVEERRTSEDWPVLVVARYAR